MKVSPEIDGFSMSYCFVRSQDSYSRAVRTGILLTFVVGGYASYTPLAAVSLAVPIAWFAAVLFLPESPVFSLKRRRQSAAEDSLRRLRGPEYRSVRREISDIQRDLDTAARNQASLG